MHTFAAMPVAQSRQLDTRNGQALPSPLAGQFESATGCDLSQVRIHTTSPSHQAAQNLNARAFAFGQDIHFGAGEFDPSSRQGMHLIAHEVAHTLQQRMSRSDVPVAHTPARASAAAEQEADAFADAFMRGGTHRLSEQTGAPVIAPAPKGKHAPEPDLPGTRRVALNTGLNDLAMQFGPVVVAGRKLELSLRLALKGNVKGVLPEPAKPEKGQNHQKRPADPGPASALATLREAISQAKPVISGPVLMLDLAGAVLKVGVTQAGKTVQQILSVHATNKLTLHAAGLEFVGSANAHLVTTVSPVANADASAVADGEGVLSELSFLGQAAQLIDVVEGTGHDAKITKPHNIASSDPAMAGKLLAVKAVLNLADDTLRNEIMADVRANAVAANEKKPAKKQLAQDALAAKADADARKAVDKTQFASTQFGDTIGSNEVALRLLEFMRPWFGSDEKTISHFQKMRRVKGQKNLLAHDSLARRLEAVQDIMGKRYPKLGQNAWPHTSVGWSFRGELQLGARQGHANMHKIGQAVDFDAYNLPMIKPGETRALIQAVTGRSNALFQPGPHGEKGFTEYGHRRATVRAIEADPAAAKNKDAFLASLSAAIDATAKASYDFRHSLDTPPVPGAGSVNDAANATNSANAAGSGQPAVVQNDDPSSGWAKFDALRNEWADAIEMPDSEDEKEKKAKEDKLAKVQDQIVSLLQPWLAKIEAHQQQMIKEAREKNNVDITAAAPQVKPLQDAEKPLKALAARLARKPATVLTEKEQKQIADAARLTGFALPDPVTPAAVSELAERVSSKRKSEETRLKERKVVADQDAAYWWDGQLIEKLKNDKAFLFGKFGYNKDKKRTWSESVDQPGAGQMLRRGWFRVAEPGATESTPSKEFMLEMAQHGFEMGASWGSSDSMHYEVAV